MGIEIVIYYSRIRAGAGTPFPIFDNQAGQRNQQPGPAGGTPAIQRGPGRRGDDASGTTI